MSRNVKKKLRDRALVAMVLTLVLGFGVGVIGMITIKNSHMIKIILYFQPM